MKYEKYIILYTSNYCERVNDFFCISDWIKNGFDIEYWDLSQFTCHENLKEIDNQTLVIRKINNIKEFELRVKEIHDRSPLFMTWVNYCWYSAGFYEVISKYCCDYAFFDNGLIPNLASTKQQRQGIKHYLKAVRNRYYQFRAQTRYLKPASYYFRLSEYYTKGADKTNINTVLGWCNSGDYEHNKALKTLGLKKYIVFLDQYIPYHNDNIINGHRQLSADCYYRGLNQYFNFVEKKYGMPILIAAHPAAVRYMRENPYDGRKIYYNKTSELVKECEFVLAHFTTAISYVVANYKKMILLSSNLFIDKRPMMDNYIKTFAKLLDLPYINIDNLESFNIEDIGFHKYDEYKYRYLTNRFSEEISNFESIIQTINNSQCL